MKIVTRKDGCYHYFCALNENNEQIGIVIIDIGQLNWSSRFKDYCKGSKWAYLVRVKTSYKYTRQGIATALIKAAIKVYSDYNIYLLVKPLQRGDNDKSFLQLKEFYSRFGFVRTNELDPTMVRKAEI